MTPEEHAVFICLILIVVAIGSVGILGILAQDNTRSLHPPLPPVFLPDEGFTASNGYTINFPMPTRCLTLTVLQDQIDRCEPDSDRYWAMIELIDWYKERASKVPVSPAYFY